MRSKEQPSPWDLLPVSLSLTNHSNRCSLLHSSKITTIMFRLTQFVLLLATAVAFTAPAMPRQVREMERR
jgi:hypothetical protein